MKQDKARRVKRIVLIVSACIAALILIAVLLFVILGVNLLNKIKRVDPNAPTLSDEQLESMLDVTDSIDPEFDGPVMDSGEAELPELPLDEILLSKNVITILLVGQDREKGQVRQRSDSMILCTIDKTKKTLTMTSFLRDTWVRIPGYYDERLNVPYAIGSGGFGLLNETLKYNFGVCADYNVEVDFSGFKNIVDKLGGVEIELTNAEAKYINKNYRDNYYYYKPLEDLTAGVNTLDGRRALIYARIRGLDNDIVRSSRQRKVITAIVNKLKTLGPVEAYKLVEEILPMVTTDMSSNQILRCVTDLLPILPDLKIVSQRIPADGAYAFARIDGKSVLYISPENLEKNKQLLEDTIGITE